MRGSSRVIAMGAAVGFRHHFIDNTEPQQIVCGELERVSRLWGVAAWGWCVAGWVVSE